MLLLHGWGSAHGWLHGRLRAHTSRPEWVVLLLLLLHRRDCGWPVKRHRPHSLCQQHLLLLQPLLLQLKVLLLLLRRQLLEN